MTQPQNESESVHVPQPALSPYDTGVRCEAKPWIPLGERVTQATPAESFGKVDFDDEEGSTVCVAYVERRKEGGYILHVDPLCQDEKIRVEIHYEHDTVRLNRSTALECPGQ
jgi:hypothetical protein